MILNQFIFIFYFPSIVAYIAALKVADIELELLTNIFMMLIFHKGMRGGICTTVLQHVKANQKFMKEKQKKKNEKQTFLIHLDKDNFNGKTMSQKFRVGWF